MDKNKSKAIFEKLGFIEDSEFEGVFTHPQLLPFSFFEDDGFLAIKINMEYRIDQGKIPLTEENITNIINAFNPEK